MSSFTTTCISMSIVFLYQAAYICSAGKSSFFVVLAKQFEKKVNV